MTLDELREAIPPAYTQFIGEQLLAHISPANGRGKQAKETEPSKR